MINYTRQEDYIYPSTLKPMIRFNVISTIAQFNVPKYNVTPGYDNSIIIIANKI